MALDRLRVLLNIIFLVKLIISQLDC